MKIYNFLASNVILLSLGCCFTNPLNVTTDKVNRTYSTNKNTEDVIITNTRTTALPRQVLNVINAENKFS